MDYMTAPELRMLERRLRAALQVLRTRWTSIGGRIFGDAMICQDMLRKVRFERRARRATGRDFMAFWGPQIDTLLRSAAKGGLGVASA